MNIIVKDIQLIKVLMHIITHYCVEKKILFCLNYDKYFII